MANTFKVKSNAAMPSSSGTPDTIYTCGAPNHYPYHFPNLY